MGRKCAVDGCLSDSNRPEDTGVTFHKVPMHNDIRPKWISLCRIPEDKQHTKVIYVCSRHFLRMDFCNFKGKKYLLRQGVLPSVFPWDKSKLEAIKSNAKPDEKPAEKTEKETEVSDAGNAETAVTVKEEAPETEEVADAVPKEETEKTEKPKPSSSVSTSFSVNSSIEALDDNNTWLPAKIIEEDDEENEVLVHFENTNKHDEWISRNSSRLRPKQANTPAKGSEKYNVGERCLASWSDARKFPATVTKVLDNDTYEVLFDDGFVKNLKAHRMCKAEGRPMQASPLFDPIQSTKQERRDKKRKINIAALFGKRQRVDYEEKPEKAERTRSHVAKKQQPTAPPELLESEIFEPWVPEWEDGKPVGIESSIEASDGTRKSFVVPDPRLPEGWKKHLTQRTTGASAGKWDTVIVSPDSRRFRSRSEIKSYLDETKLMKFNWSMFDFSIHRHRNRKKELELPEAKPVEPPAEVAEPEEAEAVPEEEGKSVNVNKDESLFLKEKNCLKIPIVDSAYQCPIEGCGKTYRKENLAQMHVKHYHPEYSKLLHSTPNVADLAYARTVGESLDKSPTGKPPVKSTPKAATKPARLTSPSYTEEKPQSPLPQKKDSEIIKLLQTKPFDVKKEEEIKPPYPEIKLKDLLAKPPEEDFNTPRPRIKTLLPVIRPERSSPDFDQRNRLKRKRGLLDAPVDSPKGNERDNTIHIPQETPALPQPNDVIIEGGQVIKIVRMKQEEIINCTCGFTEEDGLMIQCDLCLCWQHAFCNNIERESQVPEKYVCFICQNPAKQRLSKRYFHDQDWLKHGVLATASFHSKDEEVLGQRFDKLKKSHDISGGLLELRDYVNSLKVKLKIAEAKNHPKLYLWSKPWDKQPLPEKVKEEPKSEQMEDDIKTENEAKEDSMLMMMLKNTKEEDENLNSLPRIPQPEAAIDSSECRLNLLEHIAHSQSLVEERLDSFEKQIEELEDGQVIEDDINYPRTRQTLSMLLRDLNRLQEFSQLTLL